MKRLVAELDEFYCHSVCRTSVKSIWSKRQIAESGLHDTSISLQAFHIMSSNYYLVEIHKKVMRTYSCVIFSSSSLVQRLEDAAGEA